MQCNAIIIKKESRWNNDEEKTEVVWYNTMYWNNLQVSSGLFWQFDRDSDIQ